MKVYGQFPSVRMRRMRRDDFSRRLMRESEVIARLRQFATDPAARGLLDDAAVLDGLGITHDSIAEGVHILPFDPPASVESRVRLQSHPCPLARPAPLPCRRQTLSARSARARRT